MADFDDITPGELTDAEVRELLVDAGLDEFASDNAARARYLEYLQGQIASTALELQPALYDQIVAQMTGTPDAAALQTAREIADRRAWALAKSFSRSEMQSIGQVIADGIEAGVSPRDIVSKLEAVKGLDGGRIRQYEKYSEYLDTLDISPAEAEARLEREYQRLLKSRKETIARTEMREATAEGNDQKAQMDGAQWKAWTTAGDDRVSEMDVENEGAGWIEIDEEFPSGHKRPPSHPNCRCTLAYRNDPPNAAAEQRAQDRADKTAAAQGG